jgi:glyoxylase-like metal-dependent hydrolase (beta-lactamase superfamily II)
LQQYAYEAIIHGQLRTNQYRYPDEQREIICTTTLIRGDGINILVDPGWRDEPLLEALALRGLAPEQIDVIYVTHLHPDHYRSARLFPAARWLAYGPEIEHWRDRIAEADRDILTRLEPVHAEVHADIRIVPTPGHTMQHTSVLFQSGGRRILIAADALLCREYYEHRTVHPISEDAALALRSLEAAGELADTIIPGHDAPYDR